MRKLLAVLSCGVCFLAAASTAEAHWYMTPGQINARIKSPQWKIEAYRRNIEQAKFTIRFVRAHKWAFQPFARRTLLRDHEWLIRYSNNEIEQLFWLTRPPHFSQWLCIHHYEGSWTDSGDPFWGGLQMDRNFMRTYAPAWLLRYGWANTWTPLQQMWVAENAFGSRGFSPWPNTARYCHLL